MSPGGSTQQLAELQIQVIGTGFVELYKKLDELKAALGKQAEQAEQNSRSIQQAFGKMASGIQASLGLAGGYVQSFVRQGMALSAEGEQIQIRFQQISYQVASLFSPEIRKAADLLQHIVAWFRNLSGEQQAHIALWAKLAVGISLVGAAAPRVAASVAGLQTAWKGLSAAMGLAAANPALLAILAVAAAVALVTTHSRTLQAVFRELGLALVNTMEQVLDVVKSVASTIDAAAKAVGGVIDAAAGATGLGGAGKDKGPDFWERTKNDPLGLRYNQALLGDKAGGALTAAGGVGAFLGGAGWLATAAATVPKIGYNLGLYGAPEGYDDAERKRKEKEKQQLSMRLGGFESLSRSYERVAVAARNATGGKTVEERQLDAQEAVQRDVARIANRDPGRPPVVQ